MSALERLALEVEDLFQCLVPISSASQPVLIREIDMATHLYHIAQEAVNNAIKHGRPRHIVIRSGGRATAPFSECRGRWRGHLTNRSGAPGAKGMGLHIMSYRARMIGGALEVRTRFGRRHYRSACRFRRAIWNREVE